MIGFLLIIGAALLLGLNFSATKLYQKEYGSSLIDSLGFTALVGLFTVILFGFTFRPGIFSGWYSPVMAGAMATVCVLYTVIGFKLMASGTVALYTVFLMAGGMLVPFFWGLAFLEETLRWQNVVGVLLILVAIILMNCGKECFDSRKLSLLIAVFFLNGFTSVFTKEHQVHSELATASSLEFVWLSGLWRFILCGAAYLILRKKNSQTGTAGAKRLRPLAIAILSVVLNGVSMFMQLYGAKTLPATMLYPVVSGGTILFTTLSSFLFFREKLSARSIFAIVLCLVGTLLFI